MEFGTWNLEFKLLMNKEVKNNNKIGFTLIELLVVISIIGVLSALLMANFAAVRERGRDTQRKSDLKQIQKALQMYYGDTQNYPTPAAFPGFPFGGSFVVGTTTYMSKVPQDSLFPAQTYIYESKDTNSFLLKATLENVSDRESRESQERCGIIPTPGIFTVCSE